MKIPEMMWLLVALSVTASFAAITKKQTSMCSKMDSVPDCLLKSSQCGPLDALLSPLLGSPHTVLDCVNKTGIPLSSSYYSTLGKSMAMGSLSALGDKYSSDPLANSAIRQCVLNKTGMITSSMTLDRSAVAEQVAMLSPPALGASVVNAIDTCPEPINFKTSSFIKCLKKACMVNAGMGVVSSFPSSVGYKNLMD